jgi:predicted amidohydrolase
MRLAMIHLIKSIKLKTATYILVIGFAGITYFGFFNLFSSFTAEAQQKTNGNANHNADTAPGHVKVATVQFKPVEGDVGVNRQQLVRLTAQAANNGAKIIVHTEMATSGYSFFSRKEISAVAETIPGPSTRAVGQIARQYHAYVVLGLPQYDPETNLYYNSIALLGPDGQVQAIYHKHNHLLESSYNAKVYDPIPVFDTEYGRIATIICADMAYPQYARAAAVSGASMILAPSNTGMDARLAQIRAFENDAVVVVANRFGKGSSGKKPDVFDQDSFTIPSPYGYDFDLEPRSVIARNDGKVLAEITGSKEGIGYADVPIGRAVTFPVQRRPELYALIGQDTLESYTQSQFKQPAPTTFAAAAVDPGAGQDHWAAAFNKAEKALSDHKSQGGAPLRLIVFPANYFASTDKDGLSKLRAFGKSNNIDLLIHYGLVNPPTSILLASNGQDYVYERTHARPGEYLRLGSHYWVIDRDYARLALMQDVDMLAPETALVLAQMGVDVVAVNADTDHSLMSALWQDRTADYLHIVVANLRGKEGVYYGGYRTTPPYSEAEGEVIGKFNTSDVRNKPSARFFYAPQILCRKLPNSTR